MVEAVLKEKTFLPETMDNQSMRLDNQVIFYRSVPKIFNYSVWLIIIR